MESSAEGPPYRQLKAWAESRDLAVLIYKLCVRRAKTIDRGLADQIRRAAIFHPLEYRRRQRPGDKSGLAEIPLYRPRLALRTRVTDRRLPACRPNRSRRQPKHRRTDDPGWPTHRRPNHLPQVPTRLTPIRHRFSPLSSAIDSVIQSSTQSSIQSSIQPSVICHRLSHPVLYAGLNSVIQPS
jgi:hypothetical protein